MKKGLLLFGIVLVLAISACAGNIAVAPNAQPNVSDTVAAHPTATPLTTATPVHPTATPISTSVNPMDTLTKMFHAWANVKSFRIKATTLPATGTPTPQESTMEVVAPDRIHFVRKGIEIIKIGATVYMNIGNGWQKVALPQGLDFSFADVKKLESDFGASTDVKFIGVDEHIGIPTLVFQYTVSIKSPVMTTTTTKVWVAVSDGLPRQTETVSQDGTKTVATFYDYNAAITIDPPIQ